MAFTCAYACVDPAVIAAVLVRIPRTHSNSVAWTKTWRVHVGIMRQAIAHAVNFADEPSLDEFIAAASADTDLKFLMRAHGEVFWDLVRNPACPTSA